MCGICGEIRFDGRSADVAAVARMTDAMESRGPDSERRRGARPDRARASPAVDHRPVRLRRPADGGQRPRADAGVQRLYLQLPGPAHGAASRWATGSSPTADSEVVIKAFHHWGARCVDRFKGMFAFAIADRETGVVTLARDRLGIKPLYLAERPGRLRFASTVRALLEAGDVDTETRPLRAAPLHELPLGGAARRARCIEGVRKLPPATVRVIRPDGSHSDTVVLDARSSSAIRRARRGPPRTGRTR